MNAVKLDQWEKKLLDRGILGAARAAGWHPGNYGGEDGWLYPIFNRDGQQVSERYKAFNGSAKMKYGWPQPKVSEYYLLADTLPSIATAGNSVILASGEPDVLALRSAGANNVICWFGEPSIPATLAEDLVSFGVEVVECYPDCDSTGVDVWAKGIVTALADTLISVRVLQLPGAANSKYDINKLWQDVAFDADKFWDALVRCPVLDVQPRPKPTLDSHRPLPFDEKALDYPQGFYDAIEQALGVVKYKHNGWSENVRCPFHDDTNPSAGWHEEKHILKCLVCHPNGEFALAKDVAEKLNIRLSDFIIKIAPATVVKEAPRGQTVGKPSIIFSWEQASNDFLSSLNGADIFGEPLPMPFVELRTLGGFAKRVPPGKMIAIVADSGIGKTSMIETLMDHWRQNDFHGVIWGPEWSRGEYVQRAVQRQGGPSFERIEEHKAWLAEERRGIHPSKRSGTALSAEDLEYIHLLDVQMRQWKGKLHFIEKMGAPVDQIVLRMADVSSAWKSAGNRLSFAVLDYVQLVNAQGRDELARVDAVLDTFKAFCVDNALVGVVGSQVTKADGRASDGGGKGNLHSMVNARSDVFNLALVLTRETNAAGDRAATANVRVVKNSTGQVGDRKLFLNAERLRWYDAHLGGG